MNKRKRISYFLMIMVGVAIIFMNSCKKVSDSAAISDIDGNQYSSVTIGTQTWMVENLKTTRLNDGTEIPVIKNAAAWGNLSTPGYCLYNYDETGYKDTYGVLYNWFTVNTDNLCPVGWHIPTDAEWEALTISLGGEGVAGSKLRGSGMMSHWGGGNMMGVTNETGFTALPGGFCSSIGMFNGIANNGYWWSATENNDANAWYRFMVNDNTRFNRGYGLKLQGCSVRCLMNK
jgi:uncharacterized protein (TIGR02145 family)